MPIELRTGLPGAGKTLGAVEHLLELRNRSPERPVYVHGIPDLKPGLGIPLDEDGVRRWHELPPGAIIVVDECQRLMPAKRGTIDSPPWIRELSTHRHRGLDFVLITQHPSLIDTYVRKLVDRHIHTVRKFGTHAVERWVWPVCQPDPNSNSARKQSDGRTFHKYSKEAMASYKSAELHTVQRTIPRYLYVGAALLVLVPLLAWLAVVAMRMVQRRAAGDAPVAAQQGAILPSGGGATSRDASDALRRADYAAWLKPRVEGLPWSAPAFDKLEVQSIPRLFCVAVDDGRCTCQTEQGTHYAVPVDRCRTIARDGLYNPFVRDMAHQQGSAPTKPVVAPVSAPSQDSVGQPDEGKERSTAAAYVAPDYRPWNPDALAGEGAVAK